MPVEDRAEFEAVPLQVEPPIPGAVPLEYEKLGIDPGKFYHLYFAENNRRAAWNLLQAIGGKEELTAGISSALDSLEMITGAYQSALRHAPVTFPLQDRRNPLVTN